MAKTRKKPDPEKYCSALRYAEKASRLLDDRYFVDLSEAFDNTDYPTFESICMTKLGLTQKFATGLWARITAPVPPTEHW